jgi:polyisoprenoid-binding protein YceI
MRSLSRLSAALLLAAPLALPAAPAAAAPQTFELDPVHTHAGFKVRHMMVTWVHGEFGKVSGSVVYDPADLSSAKVTVSIDASTIDTREKKRDDHLRSPDFLDVATFPTLTFVSKGVANANPAAGTFDLLGDLTIRGVTKEVTLKVEGPTGEWKDPWGNAKRGASATVTINRHDFGASWNKPLEAGGILVGDEVHIQIEVEMKRTDGAEKNG